MSLRLQPVRVAIGADGEGVLVFSDDALVAVLVRLSEQHEELAGQWFLETGYDGIGEVHHPTFADLAAAQDWISQKLAQQAHT